MVEEEDGVDVSISFGGGFKPHLSAEAKGEELHCAISALRSRCLADENLDVVVFGGVSEVGQVIWKIPKKDACAKPLKEKPPKTPKTLKTLRNRKKTTKKIT